MKNKIMLITYADSFGANLKELNQLLLKYFREEIGAVHILPFFPSSGDRGFAPLTYDQVEETFGTWADIDTLAKNFELMFDFMINHLSRQSPQFQDFIKHHDASPYKDMFLRFKDFWPDGYPTEDAVALLNKRKPHAPCIDVSFADGTTEKIWCTFSDEQVDLNLEDATTWTFVENALESLIRHHASVLRLDAFAFATKKLGTSCFFVEPEMWTHMARIQSILDRHQIPMLPEIHDHYKIQQKIADHGYYVYDFALPMLMLHTLYTHDGRRLAHWLDICPRKQYTTLDTHDGIGVVDVEDLLSPDEIDHICQQIKQHGANFKMDFSARAIGKPVVYQINCTYYSALDNDDAYLLARALQFFAPGIPQVYYAGLLAGENDYALMDATGSPRDISRHNYTYQEVAEAAQKPVVQKLCRLMRFRNSYDAFSGSCHVALPEPEHIIITRTNGIFKATLDADLTHYHMSVFYDEPGSGQQQRLEI